MHLVYIIYSPSLNRYYIVETEDLKRRLEWHNNKKFNDSSTSLRRDWVIYFSLECANRIQARKIELHIKRNKSRTYIENLKKYPEIS